MLKHVVLSLLIWLPVISTVPILMLGKTRVTAARLIALAVSIASLLLCVFMIYHFNANTSAMQFSEHDTWIQSLSIYSSIVNY